MSLTRRQPGERLPRLRTLGRAAKAAGVELPILPEAPPELKRQYPHVDAISDWRAQQSLRLLWDRTYDLEARLQGATATIDDLIARSSAHSDRIVAIQRAAGEALAVAQGAAGSGLSPGEPATGPGSKGDPIVPMSLDPVVMEANIKASLYHWGLANYTHWLAYVVDPWQGGDAKWYQGWDAYMEDRADPANTLGISSHDLLPLPSIYTTTPPGGYPSGGWT
jgi:hypothetical protein